MIRRIAAFFLISQLLVGSIILPLGDFSLLNELPRMYQAYQKVVSPDENSIFDFVGDYLLNGKAVLGHNQHDQPAKSGAAQFQHAAYFAMLVQTFPVLLKPVHSYVNVAANVTHLPGTPKNYSSSLFRPPLA